MKLIVIFVVLLAPTIGFGQKLPGNFTCQDLIDTADGKLSRSTDGGRTYVPINAPRPRDAFGQTLLAHDTYQCRRLARGEITAADFDALRAEKMHQLNGERNKVLVERKQLENQQRARHLVAYLDYGGGVPDLNRIASHVPQAKSAFQTLWLLTGGMFALLFDQINTGFSSGVWHCYLEWLSPEC